MNEEQAIKFIKENPGKLFKVSTISEDKARSQRQVRYYFGVVVKIIGEFHGYDPFETNEIIKSLFKKESFTDLSDKDFSHIMSLIRQLWNNKYQVYIPKPNEF